VARHIGLRELLVGVEGLALLRHLYDGTDAETQARLEEVRRLIDDEEYSRGETVAEVGARAGYGAWSSRYDDTDNPIIALEEPITWSILASIPAGRALDVACGTGRHTRQLIRLGHRVVGVDHTREMLAVARRELPEAEFAEADLRALPLPDGMFDLVVCGLALAHVGDISGATRELARVLRTGGRLVASALHPFQAYLGWHAPFEHSGGQRAFVREYAHTHSEYLSEFAAARLDVRACFEPALTEAEVRSKRRAFGHIPEATLSAYIGLPAVVVWDTVKSSRA
jgi:SAM-dependent methyltransferase